MIAWDTSSAEAVGHAGAELVEAAWRLFCKVFHSKITRPVRGEYQCLECGRVWPSAWR